MDWTQTIALGGTLIAYMTGMSVFFYHLNEKTIKDWRAEHKSQMDKIEARFEERMDKNEAHWRDLFFYFNNRLDNKNKN